jgi:hypothetical protein
MAGRDSSLIFGKVKKLLICCCVGVSIGLFMHLKLTTILLDEPNAGLLHEAFNPPSKKSSKDSSKMNIESLPPHVEP